MQSFPNPSNGQVTLRYRVNSKTQVSIKVYDTNGKIVYEPLKNQMRESGTYDMNWTTSGYAPGVYYATLLNNNQTVQSLKITVAK